VAISPATSNLNATGAVFGGQLGYNWQTGNWVWGVEGDFDGSNINKLNNIGETILAGGGGANVNWLATIRGRVPANDFVFSSTSTKSGWTHRCRLRVAD
jgi:outer membrane immunogenic protein